MKYEQSLQVLWTEGGNPSRGGHFDGAGALNELLLMMFTGRPDRPGHLRSPVYVDVMGQIPFETPINITITIETLGT